MRSHTADMHASSSLKLSSAKAVTILKELDLLFGKLLCRPKLETSKLHFCWRQANSFGDSMLLKQQKYLRASFLELDLGMCGKY
mmetsp:Transcript_87418/g.174903  ORF Transcript_87418/g.174903 Transcript_87418/m.174903 type:complete len:84 (-) Transcript_87418:2214-2465(-)